MIVLCARGGYRQEPQIYYSNTITSEIEIDKTQNNNLESMGIGTS